MVGMKLRLRSKVWFPGVDAMIKSKAMSCLGCIVTGNANAPDPLAIILTLNGPWLDIAIGFKESRIITTC